MNPLVGYKYICWDLSDHNAELYLERAERGHAIHHEELEESKGNEDKEELPGIYFCSSLLDLEEWLQELFEYVDPSGIELLEVRPTGDVQERSYANGRTAYITPAAYVRVLEDHEIPTTMQALIVAQFG